MNCTFDIKYSGTELWNVKRQCFVSPRRHGNTCCAVHCLLPGASSQWCRLARPPTAGHVHHGNNHSLHTFASSLVVKVDTPCSTTTISCQGNHHHCDHIICSIPQGLVQVHSDSIVMRLPSASHPGLALWLGWVNMLRVSLSRNKLRCQRRTAAVSYLGSSGICNILRAVH